MSRPSTRHHRRRGRQLTAAAAALLVAAALVLALIGWRRQQHTAAPPTSAAHPAAEGNLPGTPHTPDESPSSDTRSHSSPTAVGPTLARARPVSLTIPAIGIHQARLAAFGTNAHHKIAIPPATGGVPAGWYTGSPTPGQLGPSVIVGHIDSAADGPSIFFHLSQLRPGDTVRVARADHTVATFRVDSLETYPKNDFPTQRVYGNINHAGLRLISCTGTFDASWGHYLDNVVVYAHLVSSRRS